MKNQWIFRPVRAEEGVQAAEIEQICFPAHEACPKKMMLERIAAAPELFLVAVDEKTGVIAGCLNGLGTHENQFRDEFFSDASLHEAEGENIMLLGLAVLPEYRRQGIARSLLACYVRQEKEKGRKNLILTCLESKVLMYQKLGFTDLGISASAWGGEEWHEMIYPILP